MSSFASVPSPSQDEVANMLRQLSTEARDGNLDVEEKNELKDMLLQGTASALASVRQRLSNILQGDNEQLAGETKKNSTDVSEEELPYGGDMSEAMKRQDRDAIRILMAHRKKLREEAAKKKAEAQQPDQQVCPPVDSGSSQEAKAEAGLSIFRVDRRDRIDFEELKICDIE